jgi:hypothetical protein
MAGYNPCIVDIENEVLRDRLASIKAAAGAFADLVGRYIEPHKGDTYCSRNEVLLARHSSYGGLLHRNRGFIGIYRYD